MGSLFPEYDSDLATRHQALLTKVVQRRKEVTVFEDFLATKTNWLTAPASTRYHLCEPEGLLRHSIGVAETLLQLRATLAPDLSEESAVIVGLYHDVGKVGLPGKPYYIPNPNQWQRENRGIPYAINPEVVYMDIATRSLFLITPNISLTPEEAQAIRYHDGQYIDENRGVAHRECRLTLLLQFADNWTASVLE